MNSVFQEALDYFCTIYLDCILIHSSSTEKHLQYIEWAQTKLRSNCLFGKPTKHKFGLIKFEYLGHTISISTTKPDPKKTQTVSRWASPTNSKIVAGFPWSDICFLFTAFCLMQYLAILFLLYLTLTNHSKLRVIYSTQYQVVYLCWNVHLFINPLSF